jgi:hypothetical protein
MPLSGSLKRFLFINFGAAEDQRCQLFEPEGRVLTSRGASLRFIEKRFRTSEKGFGQQLVNNLPSLPFKIPYGATLPFHPRHSMFFECFSELPISVKAEHFAYFDQRFKSFVGKIGAGTLKLLEPLHTGGLIEVLLVKNQP